MYGVPTWPLSLLLLCATRVPRNVLLRGTQLLPNQMLIDVQAVLNQHFRRIARFPRLSKKQLYVPNKYMNWSTDVTAFFWSFILRNPLQSAFNAMVQQQNAATQ
jgi:hypothetical protein